jgi:hypothetical protein
METALVSLFTVIMLVVTMMTMVMTTLGSVNMISEAFQTMEKKAVGIQLTAIDSNFREFQGDTIALDVANIGQTNLADYASWNVLVQLENGNTVALNFVDSPALPGDNEWTVNSIRMANGQPEIFDPDILNPSEEMTVLLVLMPALGSLESARITLATPNGITSQTQITAPYIEP